MIKICKICGEEFNKPLKPKQITCSRSCRSKMNGTTHGMTKDPFYITWARIKTVCSHKSDDRYYRYGGRGIKNCWKSFEEFRNDMYESYKIHLDKFGRLNTTIDRIDNNGNYCKENCKWATRKEQAGNRANRVEITFNGETHSIKEWSEIKHIKNSVLWNRLFRNKWSIEKSLSS
jgi:predicted nucleic acid-binding Zn ribbon protein